MSAFSAPNPVLKEGVVYFGDNGRTFCRKHAGASALYTGRDVSGQRVVRVPRALEKEFPCESCEREEMTVLGVRS